MNSYLKVIYLFIFSGLLSCSKEPAHNFDVRKYGLSGEKSEMATGIIQKAINDCHATGGGVVYFPPGHYTTGTIELKSNVTLYLEAGAIIYASLDTIDYPQDYVVYKKNDSGKKGDGITPVLIYAKNAENIGITGPGKIDGQGQRTYEDLKEVDGFIKDETENARTAGVEMKMYYKVAPFTCMVFLESSKNVKISKTSFIESTDWTLHFKWCENVFVSDIYLQSSLDKGVNADGIDVDGCKNVVISNCIVETGDDAIVLKSTQTFNEFKACENVTVSNCVLVSTSTALKLGTESFGDFKNILFNNCVITNTNRALSIVVRDGANVSNVVFSDILIETNRKHFNWWGNGDPIWLVVKKRNENSKVGSIQNVTFNNIIARGQGTSKLEGFEGSPLKNIRFNNVQLTMEAEEYKDKRATEVLYASRVQGLYLNDVTLTWDTAKGTEPKWTSALKVDRSSLLRFDKVMAKPSSNLYPAMVFTDVADVYAERMETAPGTKVFAKVTGNSSGVSVKDVRTPGVQKIIEN